MFRKFARYKILFIELHRKKMQQYATNALLMGKLKVLHAQGSYQKHATTIHISTYYMKNTAFKVLNI